MIWLGGKVIVNKLRVWWIPQVPGKIFYVSVDTIKEAKLVLKTLAEYDLFQLKNNIKSDFCNAGGFEEYMIVDLPERYEWCEWENENGDDIDHVNDNGESM